MSRLRRTIWLLFRIWIISFSLLPLYVVRSVFSGGEITVFWTVFTFLFSPTVLIFNTSMSFPLFIRNKTVLIVISSIFGVVTFLTFNILIPVTYFFPQVFIFIAYYVCVLLIDYFFVINLGISLYELLYQYIQSYQSPHTLGDLAKNTPTNFVSTEKTVRIGRKFKIFLMTFFVFSYVVTFYIPSFWGVGIYEEKKTFLNLERFQNAVNKRFFDNQLSGNIEIVNYLREPFRSQCRQSLPSEILNNLEPAGVRIIKEEIVLRDKETRNTFALAVFEDSFPINSDFDSQVDEDLQKLTLSKSYFQRHYPGYTLDTLPDNAVMNNLVKKPYIEDKSKIWFLKSNSLLCTQSVSLQEEASMIQVLRNFSSSRVH